MTISVIHSHPVWLQQTQTWMHGIVSSLPTSLVTSHVVCNRVANFDQFPVSSIHELKSQNRLYYFANQLLWKSRLGNFSIGRLSAKIKELDADIVHSHFGHVGARDSKRVKRAGAKHVVTFYGFDVSLLPKQKPSILKSYRAMFENSDLFLAEGPAMAKQIESLGCPSHKIRVQRIGVELERFEFRPRTWQPGQILKVLIAGTFVEKKGIRFALEALAIVAKKHKLKISIIGDGQPTGRSREEKEKILECIQANNLQELVELLGYQKHDRMHEIAYEHHLFVSPSVTSSDGDNEGGSPVAITEFAAAGMPIVSTVHCDIPEVVVDGETGWLAAERDVEGLAKKIEQALESYPSWLGILEKGRKHLEGKFDLAEQGVKLAHTYLELIGKPRVVHEVSSTITESKNALSKNESRV